MYDIDKVYINTLTNIIENGNDVSCRGAETLELMGNQTIVNMAKPVLTIEERKLGYKFMVAEASWILKGDNRVSSIEKFSKTISSFSDNKEMFFGAYGPKVIDQLSYICETLGETDRFSRQAYLNIWREQPRKTKDVPCTIGLQWMIRDGKLHCFDTMRSSDIWLGWPYDVFNMSMISLAICLILRDRYGVNVELGNLTLTAASQHLYARNANEASKLIECKKHMHIATDFNTDHYSDFEHFKNCLTIAAHEFTKEENFNWLINGGMNG